MSSQPQLPSPDNDYAPPPGTRWNVAVWLATLTHMAARVRALEGVRATLDDIINELQVFGLQRLDEAILPLIQQQQAALADLQQQIATALADTQALVTTFQQQTADALAGLGTSTDAAIADLNQRIDATIADLEQTSAAAIQTLNDSLAAVQDQVDTILAGGIPAANVAESAERVFVSPAQRAQIDEIDATLQTLTEAVDTAISGLQASVNASLASYERKWEPWVTTIATTAILGDRTQVRVDTSGGARTRQLPNPTAAGTAVRVQRAGSGLLTVDANGSVIRTTKGDVSTLEISIDGLALELARDATNSFWIWR